MDPNETYNIVSTLLQNTQVGIYANKILLGIGGIASATLIYFVIMVTLNYKDYKLQKINNKMIEEIYERTVKQDK